jgi:hypothetical protein
MEDGWWACLLRAAVARRVILGEVWLGGWLGLEAFGVGLIVLPVPRLVFVLLFIFFLDIFLLLASWNSVFSNT